jgi:protocatechuate 3,4-dioxygenase beta subunit
MRNIALALLMLSAVAAHAQAPVRLTVQGRVIARGSGTPVANAQLVAAKVGGSQEDYRTTSSDASGRFVFPDLTPGAYRIHADHPHYLRGEYGRTPVAAAGTPITIDERTAVSDLIVALTPTGVITGVVTDGGRPARNVWVRALKVTYSDGQRTVSVQDYAVTDDRGEYRLFGLPPGPYLVSAIPAARPRVDGEALVVRVIPSNANGNQSEIRSPLTLDNVTAAAFSGGVYPAVYYPGTTDTATAASVDVTPGALVPGIDLSLRQTATFAVRGRVTTQGLTTPNPKIRISLSTADEGAAPAIPAVEVEPGDFALAGVPPGRYHLAAHVLPAPGERAGPAVTTRVPLEVWDRDVEGVMAVLQPDVRITGKLLIDGAPPPAAQRPRVALNGMNGLPGTGAQAVQDDGTFVFENVAPGSYRWRLFQVGAGPRIPLWVKSARFGSDDANGQVLVIDPEAASRSLEIDISTRTATLEAVVMDDRRRPIAGVLVMAVPEASRRSNGEAFRSAVTDSTGRVKLEGVAPGTYTLFATETIPAESWQDPAVLKRLEARGHVVKVGEAAVSVVELRITP